jgi:hypothetical protein
MKDIRHGTNPGYTGGGCRCQPCKSAHAQYQRDYIARVRSGDQVKRGERVRQKEVDMDALIAEAKLAFSIDPAYSIDIAKAAVLLRRSRGEQVDTRTIQ